MRKLSDCWETPQWLFDELDKEFHFDLDLCATKDNSKCDAYGDDYLNDCWEVKGTNTTILGARIGFDLEYFNQEGKCIFPKTAFMNPPYSNPKPFIEKAWEDSKHCKIVCLVKCDPSTRWWATFWNYEKDATGFPYNKLNTNSFKRGPKPGCEVRFLPKRIKFDPPKGYEGKIGSPTFPSAIVIMDRRGL